MKEYMCAKCTEIKPRTEFYRAHLPNRIPHGKRFTRRKIPVCKVCAHELADQGLDIRQYLIEQWHKERGINDR